MRGRIRFGLTAAVIATVIVGVLANPALSGEAPSPVSNTAPAQQVDFTLKGLDGKPMRLRDLRGHPVIVDFWATWCGPCRRQIPELQTIYQRYRRRGLKVIGVACDTVQGDGLKAIGPFVAEFHIGYPILLADDATVDRLDIEALPTTLFLGRDGHLVSRVMGAARTAGELSAEAKKLMRLDAVDSARR